MAELSFASRIGASGTSFIAPMKCGLEYNESPYELVATSARYTSSFFIKLKGDIAKILVGI